MSDLAFERAFDAERAETIRTRSRWIWGGSVPVWIVSFLVVDRAVFTTPQALTVRVPELVLALGCLAWLQRPRSLRALEVVTVCAWAVIALVSSYGFLVMAPETLAPKVASLMLSVLVVSLLGSFTWQATLGVALVSLLPLASLLLVGATPLFQLTLTVVGFAWTVLVVSAAARDRLKRSELLARRGLVAANERLQREDELKRRLFVNLSHDLRTPLAIVRGEAAVLRASGRLADDDAALFRVERNAAALAQLADQLLDLARLEAGQMPVRARPCDLGALAHDLATQLAPQGERRIVVRVASERVVARVDPSHARRILTNLLANALRQTRSTTELGVVTIEVRATGGGGAAERIEVDVLDEGPGVPPERRDAIFVRFVSFESDGNTTSGIGLPLARELAVVNAGTLVLVPEAPQTTFRLSLPATKEIVDGDATSSEPSLPAPIAPVTPVTLGDALPPSPPLAAPDPRPGRRVLVVEDNADMGLLLVRALGTRYRVEHVTRVADALALLREDPPTAILSDVMLPDGTGYDVLRAVRRSPELARMPVVLVSALGDVEQRVRGLAAGADDYVPKPFAPEELASRVAAAIARADAWGVTLGAQRDALLMEVHDGVSASLSRAAMLLSELQPLAGSETVAHAREAIRDGLDEVRAITRLLAPKPVTFESLTGEVRRAMADACAAARLELDFHAELDEETGSATVAPAIAHTLRRVAREATTNTIKHAGARRLACRLGADREAFTLRVEDDGRGLPEVRAEGQGLGIMARRVARVGGTVEVGNRGEAGASGAYVEARLPRMTRGPAAS